MDGLRRFGIGRSYKMEGFSRRGRRGTYRRWERWFWERELRIMEAALGGLRTVGTAGLVDKESLDRDSVGGGSLAF